MEGPSREHPPGVLASDPYAISCALKRSLPRTEPLRNSKTANDVRGDILIINMDQAAGTGARFGKIVLAGIVD
jgi:hypothetical protein